MSDSVRTVVFVLGIMLAALAVTQLIPALVDLTSDAQSAHAFLGSAVIGGFVGGVMALMARGGGKSLTPRGAIIVTGGSWMLLCIAGAIPMKLAGIEISWTDAIFESTSGLTTTGATVLTQLGDLPTGILIWRSILQWIGGIGIVVTAMAIWPMLGIGGMQLFRLESSDTSEKALPRAGQIAGAVSGVYLALTIGCFVSYVLTGMEPFDAMAHAMTTVATGGFSTRDASIGAFAEGGSDMVATVFMLLAALPFVLYLRAVQGRPDHFFRDSQVRAFLGTTLAVVIALTVWLVANPPADQAYPAWRLAALNGVSILTGTGYAHTDFNAWGGGATAIFLLVMFIGGCAGSTTCSVKIFRYQIAASAMLASIRQLARPHAVHSIRYQGKRVPGPTVRSVLGFFFIFFASYLTAAVLLSLIGLDPVTALSGAAATLANVGPGLGDVIGPSSTYQSLPDAAKWVMTMTMLLGRLEVLTLLVMFTPGFWRG